MSRVALTTYLFPTPSSHSLLSRILLSPMPFVFILPVSFPPLLPHLPPIAAQFTERRGASGARAEWRGKGRPNGLAGQAAAERVAGYVDPRCRASLPPR